MLALVTGGNRGIGFAIAKKLAENGYEVVIAARDKKKLKEAREALSGFGVDVHSFVCDVTDKKDIAKLARSVGKIGPLDLLVNDAGVAYRNPLLQNDDREIDQMIAVNFRGLVECCRAFLPGMVKMKRGTIINISSGGGKTGYPELAVYCATKFAVIGFTQALAGEVEGDGVRVYAICPRSTESDMWHSLYPGDKAKHVPEDVAIEVMELLRDKGRISPGSAIDVRKHAQTKAP
jgi:short-subunit dehydrogenase